MKFIMTKEIKEGKEMMGQGVEMKLKIQFKYDDGRKRTFIIQLIEKK